MMKLTLANRAPSTSRRAVSVQCFVQPQQDTRRALLSALLTTPILFSQPALALLPDDDDEDLLNKAKANRRSRLVQERQTERAFLQTQGNVNRRLEPKLVPVQKAIKQLAIAGQALEAGDNKAAAAAIESTWVSEFKSAAEKISADQASKDAIEPIFSGINTLKEAASKNSSTGARAAFVSTVNSLKDWSVKAEVNGLVKGL